MANQPSHKFRIGNINATIWLNNESYSVEITRSFKNEAGDWRSSSSFNHSDLLNVAKCAERAEVWIGRKLHEDA